jgi:hypothetical protein
MATAAAILAALMTVAALGCAQMGGQGGSSTAPAASPSDLVLSQLKEDRSRIDQTTDEMMKRIDAYNTSRKPGDRTLQFSEIFSEDLSPEQRDVLNTLIEQEKDVSYKALLQKIIADRDSIRSLQEKVMHLEQTLPDQFAVARKGDTHYKLAHAYLTEEAKLDSEKAKTLLAQADQTDELLTGNKVWFFYDPQRDSFRTYVTQGEAGQTPLAVRRALQRKLVSERDAAQAQVGVLEGTKAALEASNASLEATRNSLQGDVMMLRQNKAELKSAVDRLSRDIAFRQNSLFYHAANTRELKDQGVITSALKRFRDVKGVHFDEALDLRQRTTITLTPGEFGLERIKQVKLLPSIFQEGRDFTIETAKDERSAKVTILDPDIFRGKEVLLAIGG